MHSVRSSIALVVIAMVCACRGDEPTTPTPSAAAAPATPTTPPPSAECLTMFDAPEGMTLLCDEHIRGGNGEEIHWRSWATLDARVTVNDRYADRAHACGYGLTTKPPIFSVAHEGWRLATYERNEGGYPTCSVPIDESAKTVLVISQMM